MPVRLKDFRIFALMAAAALTLSLSACSSTSDDAGDVNAQSTMGAEGAGGPLYGTEVAGDSTAGVTPGTQADLVANVGDRVFYGYDRYDLTDEARNTLDLQAQWLAKYPNVNVTIEGHCDERGTREYNLALGERRAATVKSYLVARGVDPNRLSTISYGKERPAVPGSDEASWAQNRRGVTKVD
ncbi:MAG TPA: peptidoglycan-associated lipoprotein Pal [Alphaproteobacteria bacterium]|nr:peptidoglycan-associated lipoprotein Pal [Alphaproteobacteria bacterium]